MKTIKDICNMVVKYNSEYYICNTYGRVYCDTCSKYFIWCFRDSYVLALDYLYRGEYYG